LFGRMDMCLTPAYCFYSGSYKFPCGGVKIFELHSCRKPEKFGLQLGEILLKVQTLQNYRLFNVLTQESKWSKVTELLFVFTTTGMVINEITNTHHSPLCRSLVLAAVTARFIRSSTSYSNCSVWHKTTLWTKYKLSPMHNPVFSNMISHAVRNER
jgi:hypothetical protein